MDIHSGNITLLVIGLVMLALSKWIIALHMKMYMFMVKNVYKQKYMQKPGWLKFYRIFFAIVWIALGCFFVIGSINSMFS
jgi:hypothetical protein